MSYSAAALSRGISPRSNSSSGPVMGLIRKGALQVRSQGPADKPATTHNRFYRSQEFPQGCLENISSCTNLESSSRDIEVGVFRNEDNS